MLTHIMDSPASDLVHISPLAAGREVKKRSITSKGAADFQNNMTESVWYISQREMLMREAEKQSPRDAGAPQRWP